jgi:hypothetical protein
VRAIEDKLHGSGVAMYIKDLSGATRLKSELPAGGILAAFDAYGRHAMLHRRCRRSVGGKRRDRAYNQGERR